MSTNTIVVTVQGSENGKFYMDGNDGVLALKYGDTYIFDVSDIRPLVEGSWKVYVIRKNVLI